MFAFLSDPSIDDDALALGRTPLPAQLLLLPQALVAEQGGGGVGTIEAQVESRRNALLGLDAATGVATGTAARATASSSSGWRKNQGSRTRHPRTW